jgi:hypothetical protein
VRLLIFPDMGGVERKPKLECLSFVTFRLPRVDKDWMVGEILEVVIQRIGDKKYPLGQAEIIYMDRKERREYYGEFSISDEDAQHEGYKSSWELSKKLFYARKAGQVPTFAYKLTLEWKLWYSQMIQYQTGEKPLEQKIIDRMAATK